jgi:branched-subunit amino acid transport protein
MMSQWKTFLTILGMAAVTVLCRSLFLLPSQEPSMPRWLREGLRYAPLAAMAAVISPEIFLTHGQIIRTWQEPRIFGAIAGLVVYACSRSLFATIVSGTGVMLAIKFGLGW